MTALSDAAVARLREALERPDAGTRYVVGELIGRGGMGSVYRATDTVLGRDVALKVLSTEVEAPVLARQLADEARVLAALDHPGIVAVHDVGVLADGRPFYVMRLVRGDRLGDRARTVTRGEALRLFLRVCEAVAFAHARGIVHRDLTPSNVMVGAFGEVLVLDWGLATSLSAATPTPIAGGTPGFMAPEQCLAGGVIDPRTDVFGLGAILGALLRAPGATVPKPLRAIITRASEPVAADRYAGADALADDVRRWLDAEPVSAYREPAWERIARLYQRHQALVLLLATYLGVRVLIFVWRRI